MQRPLCDRAVIKVFKDKKLVYTGNIYDAREYIETLLAEKLDFFVSLQEFFEPEDKEYTFYVHTDAYEDLEIEEMEQLTALGITEDDSPTTENIMKLFNLKIEFSHYLDS